MSEIILPGIYNQEINSGPRTIQAVQSGIIGLVGAAPKGPVDEIVQCSTFSDVEKRFGPIVTGNDISEKANVMFNAGASQINIIRVTSGSPVKSTKTFNDSLGANSVSFTAKDFGTFGDQIKVAIEAATTGGMVNVRITDEYSNVEEFYQMKNMIAGGANYLVDAVNAASTIVSSTKLNANIPVVTSSYLAGGNNGTAIDSNAIIGSADSGTGLKALEADPTIGILMCASGTDVAVWAEMLAQCNRTLNRICGLNLANGLTTVQAVSAITSYEGARAFVSYPSVKIYDYVTGASKFISGTFVTAGILSGLATHLSPSNQTVNGIIGLEKALNQADMETLYKARLNPISVVYGAGIKMRGGITMSSDPKWSQICKRREMDKIEQSVKSSMNWAISQPNTPVLRDNVATSVNGLLASLMANGEIGSSSKAICDSSNNTAQSIANGFLICDVLVEFIYPADKIIFRYQEKIGGTN